MDNMDTPGKADTLEVAVVVGPLVLADRNWYLSFYSPLIIKLKLYLFIAGSVAKIAIWLIDIRIERSSYNLTSAI
jgi:hypothetical protein